MTTRPTTPQQRARALLTVLDNHTPTINQPIPGSDGPLLLMLKAAEWREHSVITLTSGSQRHLVLLQAGVPVDYQLADGPQHGTFRQWLLQTPGGLSPAEHEQTLVAMERHSISYDEALHRSGVMSPSRVTAHRTTWLKERLSELMTLRQGRFSFSTLPTLPYAVTQVELRLPQLALQHTVASLASRRLMMAFAHHIPTPVQPAPFKLDELFALPASWNPERDLVEDARYLFKQMNGKRKLKDVQTLYVRWLGCSYPADPFESLVQAFLKLGLITMERNGQPRLRDDAWETALSIRTQRDRVTNATSPFEVLGAHWSDTGAALTARYNEALKQILPSRYPEPLRASLYDDLIAIRDSLNAARAQLATPALRRKARRKFVNDADVAQTLALYREQLKLLMVRNAHEQAREVCLKALELQPRHPLALRTLKQLELAERTPLPAPPKPSPSKLSQIRFS